MNVKKKHIISVVLVFILLLLPALPAFAGEQETIRVGYYEDGDYMSRGQSGEYEGYNIEYLQQISKQSGIYFEIIDCKSWNAAYKMLVDGEIDVLPAVYQTEERAKEILFSSQPMCSIYTTLNVRTNDERYDYEDFEAFQGMDVGIIRDGVDGEAFRKFCREHKISLNIINYDTTGEVLAALDAGTLDGVAITHLGKNSTFRSVAQFSPSPLYFAVTKGKPELQAELNRAMNNILLSNPGYGTVLYDKYLATSANQKPVFTKEERQFIQQTSTIVVSYDSSFAPLCYKDKATGEFKGVTADVFSFIAENSGLKFKFEEHSQPEALKLLKKGKIDALSVSDGDYLWDGRNKVNSTLAYLHTSTSMLTKDGEITPKTLALPEGYRLSESIAEGKENYKAQYYPSVEACLNAVLVGKVDGACVNTQVAGAFLSKGDYKQLNTATLSQYNNEICIGIGISEDPRLLSIINKCIQYLPAEQVDASLVEHATSAKEVSITEFIQEHSWQTISIVFVVLGIIILLITYNLKNALRSNRRIQDLLYKDELTGAYNMDGFYRYWEENNFKMCKQEYVLLYGDICQFKFINDNFGFSTGDRVLCGYTAVMQELLKDDEACGRLSADHFAILMKYNTWDELIERLTLFTRKLNEWKTSNTEILDKIDVIFGVCRVGHELEIDTHQKLDLANYARRNAKGSPDRLAVMYNEEMRNQALLVQQLEGGLDRGLRDNEFEVYYQPKVSMRDKKIIGSEALIRWNHPKKGFLMPGTFVSIFEKNGMIRKIDLWVFEDVCKTIATWAAKGIPLLPVSCNFSRLHFQQKDFPEMVCAIADRWKVPHNLLELEITESALLEESIAIERMSHRLKAEGFRIAIDDFGSGYSSLGQLQQLTADVLKLDRSFVSHGISGQRERIVVGNVIQMADQLGMVTICEGVETEMQSKALLEIGCEYSQGFYFYRPMTKEDYERVIQ